MRLPPPNVTTHIQYRGSLTLSAALQTLDKIRKRAAAGYPDSGLSVRDYALSIAKRIASWQAWNA